MSEFELFEQAMCTYEEKQLKNQNVKEKTCNSSCFHEDIINENGIMSCLNCGEEISHSINHEKEWRYYGHVDNKRSSDPNRVQIRKNEDKNIMKDVENMGFSETIV